MTLPDAFDVAWKSVTVIGGIIAALNAKKIWRLCWGHGKLVASNFELEARLTEKDLLLKNAHETIKVAASANTSLQSIIEGFNLRIEATERIVSESNHQVHTLRGEQAQMRTELTLARAELEETRLSLRDGIVWIVAVMRSPTSALPPIPDRLKPQIDKHLNPDC